MSFNPYDRQPSIAPIVNPNGTYEIALTEEECANLADCGRSWSYTLRSGCLQNLHCGYQTTITVLVIKVATGNILELLIS